MRSIKDIIRRHRKSVDLEELLAPYSKENWKK